MFYNQRLQSAQTFSGKQGCSQVFREIFEYDRQSLFYNFFIHRHVREFADLFNL